MTAILYDLNTSRLLRVIGNALQSAMDNYLFAPQGRIYYNGSYYENQEMWVFHQVIELDKKYQRELKLGNIGSYEIIVESLDEVVVHLKPIIKAIQLKIEINPSKASFSELINE